MTENNEHLALWGGRFTSGPSPELARLSKSTQFDWRLADDDIAGSRAHARALGRAGLLTADELQRMEDALDTLQRHVDDGSFAPIEDDEDEATAGLDPIARDEVLDLEAAGIKVIQIDEAALREKLPLRKTDWHAKYLDWAIPAFRLVHSAVKPTTQIHTHMCYSEFNDIIRDIDAMDADVISFEASRGDLVVLDAIHDANFETEAGPGVYDIHSPRIPSEQEIEDRIYEILKKMDVEKVWINPDCGLKTRGNAETWPSLENLVAAAKAVRAKLAK